MKISVSSSFVVPLIMVCFIFSGMLKWFPFPVDMTIFTGGLCCLVLLFIVATERQSLSSRGRVVVISILAFIVWYIVTAVYTVSTSFWQRKTMIMGLNLIAFLLPIVYLTKANRFENFDRVMIVAGLACILPVIGFFLTGNIDLLIRLGVSENSKIPDYLSLGLVVGASTLIMLSRPRIFYWISAALGFFTLVALTGRGPLLFSMLIAAMLYWVTKGKDITVPMWLKSVALLFAVGGFGWFFQAGGADVLLLRLENLKGDQLRLGVFGTAADVISQNLMFGVGIGGFGVAGYGLDEDAYPHNILLEVLAEAGVIGFLIFAVSLGFTLLKIPLALKTEQGIRYLAVFGFIFLNYMKSGGFTSARDLYMFWGVFLAYCEYSRSQRLLYIQRVAKVYLSRSATSITSV